LDLGEDLVGPFLFRDVANVIRGVDKPLGWLILRKCRAAKQQAGASLEHDGSVKRLLHWFLPIAGRWLAR
jgi:hypothetical protein